jgi:NADH-quinone oxidoreductase subunit M
VGLVFAPAVAVAFPALASARVARAAALAVMLTVAAMAVMAVGLDAAGGAAPPVPGAWFAVDPGNAVFLLLTALVFPAVLAGNWDAPEMGDRTYLAQLLLLETALLATFLAQDLLVLFVAWEAALLPMLLMIVTRGGEQRVRAATTFFLYTMAGSVPFLAAVILLGVEARTATGSWAFDFATLQSLRLSESTQTFVFAAIAFACAIKIPVVPFHGWLPRAYGEAPASGTALMAAVLSKMGAFGLLRLAIPLAPLAAARYAPVAVALGVTSLLYGALLALRQTRPRQLVAHASLSHMGFVVVGAFTLTAAGLHGALLQVLGHGFAVAGLFIAVGQLERRAGDDAAGTSGLARRAPRFAVVLMAFVLASIALPTTAGFAAEFLVLLGAFQRGLVDWAAGRPLSLAAAGLACTAIVLGAAYMLRFARDRVFGSFAAADPVPDLGPRELTVASALIVAILWLGLWPASAMQVSQPAVERLVTVSPLAAAVPVASTVRATDAAASAREPLRAD